MWTTNVNFEIIDLSVIEFVCIRVIQIIANEYSFEENISSGTRNVIALIFVHNKSHDLKNLKVMYHIAGNF